jgi:WD40 repeat protein
MTGFSPDGKLLVTRNDNSICFHRVSDGSIFQTFPGYANHAVSALNFSKDGTLLATGSDEGTVRLWRVADEESLLSLDVHPQQILDVAISPDGKTLSAATVWYDNAGGSDVNIDTWRISDGGLINDLRGRHEYGSADAMLFSPDGTIIAEMWQSWIVILYRVSDRKKLHILEAPNWTDMAFSPDGAALACAYLDGTIRLLQVPTGILLRAFDGAARDMVFSPDGTLLATAGSDK